MFQAGTLPVEGRSPLVLDTLLGRGRTVERKEAGRLSGLKGEEVSMAGGRSSYAIY